MPSRLALVFAGGAQAEDKGLDNHAKRDPYYEKLKGKKVLFVPLAMGFDLTEGWAAIMRRQAKDLGYTFEIRDPNWSTDAGTRAITERSRRSQTSLLFTIRTSSPTRSLSSARSKRASRCCRSTLRRSIRRTRMSARTG